MQDFGHCSIDEQAKIGMKGARGLKAGVLAQRRETAARLLQTQLAAREEEMRVAVNKATQDTQSLIDEFL